MKRHELDPTSLIAGLIFVGVGIVFLVDLSSEYSARPRWILAVVLIGIGLAGLISAVTGGRRGPAMAGEDTWPSGVPTVPATSAPSDDWPSDRSARFTPAPSDTWMATAAADSAVGTAVAEPPVPSDAASVHPVFEPADTALEPEAESKDGQPDKLS